jgi:hypothetical protein
VEQGPGHPGFLVRQANRVAMRFGLPPTVPLDSLSDISRGGLTCHSRSLPQKREVRLFLDAPKARAVYSFLEMYVQMEFSAHTERFRRL